MRRHDGDIHLVGREAELDGLDQAVAAAQRGEPTITLVGGEAGMGKTSLVAETAARALAAGLSVLSGECVALEGGEFLYAPLVGALRDAESAARTLHPAAQAELARLLPAMDLAVPAASLPDRPTEDAPARLQEVLFALVRRLCEDTPVLLIVEDAHWADAPTRDFLVYLHANLGAERLAVLITYRLDRPDALDEAHPLHAVLDKLRGPKVVALTLTALDRGGVEAQLDGLLARAAPRRLVDTILRRSGGNPLFVEELARSHARAGPSTLPAGVRDALLQRAKAVPDETGAALRALAVLGRPADPALLAAVAGVPEAELDRRLRPGLEAGVVALRRNGAQFDLAHALMREAISARLMPGERRALHLAAAAAFEASGDGTPAELAFHLDAGGKPASALDPLLAAGLAAERIYAYADARQHFERALELWPPDGAGGDARVLDHPGLLMHAAEAARMTGDWDAAVTRIEQARDEVDPGEDPVRAAVLIERLGDYQLWDDAAARAAYDAALALLPDECVAERARLLARQALTLLYETRYSDARRLAETALRLAEEAHAQAELALAKLTLGTAMAFLGSPEAGESQVADAQRICRRLGWPQGLARSYSHLAEVRRIRADVAGALELMLEGAEVTAEMGMSGSFGRAMSVNAAEDMFHLGQWDAAAQRLRECSRLELRFAAELLQETVLGQLHVARGEFDEARAALQRARDCCDETTTEDYLAGVNGAWAELALWCRRPEDAEREVLGALEALGSLEDPLYTPVLYSLAARAAADLAERARAVGSDELARILVRSNERLQRLEALIARHSETARPPEAVAHLALCAAELSRAEGRPAPPLWAEAADRWESLGQPYPAAYARWRQAQAALRSGETRGEAAGALEAARAGAATLGARPLLTEIDALAEAANLMPRRFRGPLPEPAADDLGLTARELEVLRLLARGSSNEQIGQQLFISPKTASVHVGRILRKMDAPNRTAAADMAHQLGLVDTAPTGG